MSSNGSSQKMPKRYREIYDIAKSYGFPDSAVIHETESGIALEFTYRAFSRVEFSEREIAMYNANDLATIFRVREEIKGAVDGLESFVAGELQRSSEKVSEKVSESARG